MMPYLGRIRTRASTVMRLSMLVARERLTLIHKGGITFTSQRVTRVRIGVLAPLR